MNPVLELRGVSFSYKGAERPSLKDVDLAIGRKERTVIMGANGAGKSTLFHHLNGILKPDRGAVLFGGEPVSYRRKGLRTLRSKVSLVMQNPDDQIFGQTVEADASVTTYAGEKASLADLQVGSHVMAWYDIVLLSYPGQAGTDHLMLLPGAAEEQNGETAETSAPAETTDPAGTLQDGTELSIVLEGDMVLPVTGKVENGAAMVPVAAVAQALGYEVTYTPGENGEAALVTVEDDSFRVNLNIGDNLIQGVTKIEGAVGMTSPMDYGMAPYIVEPGTTWAPAQLFEMLGRTVTVDGDTLSIQ